MAIGLGRRTDHLPKRQEQGSEQSDLDVTHCIEPWPGSLVMFTVPRFHRICRVDRVAGEGRRLSIAGWFMTEHRKVR